VAGTAAIVEGRISTGTPLLPGGFVAWLREGYEEDTPVPITNRIIVAVGANGSGKTSYGYWLAQRDGKNFIRVGGGTLLGEILSGTNSKLDF
jgi:hypothetical protein